MGRRIERELVSPLWGRPLMGVREVATLFGVCDKTVKKRLRLYPGIRSVKDHRGRKFLMEDVFAAMFPGATCCEIYSLMLEYLMAKAQGRSRRRDERQNDASTQA